MQNITSLYQKTTNNKITLTDELLDYLGETYQNRIDEHTKNMNFTQFVEYYVWKLSRNIK